MDKDQILAEFPAASRPALALLLAGRTGEVPAALRAAGVTPNVASASGLTPLFLAATAGDEAGVRALLAAGADPNGRRGRAPIHAAMGVADATIGRILLQAGADPNGLVDDQPALSRAALIGNQAGVTALLAAGATVNLANAVGVTPIIEASAAGQWRVAETLLAAGADLAAASRAGVTAGLLAQRSRLAATTLDGQARQRVVAEWQRRGLPWPPPSAPATKALIGAGAWPPR